MHVAYTQEQTITSAQNSRCHKCEHTTKTEPFFIWDKLPACTVWSVHDGMEAIIELLGNKEESDLHANPGSGNKREG